MLEVEVEGDNSEEEEERSDDLEIDIVGVVLVVENVLLDEDS